MRNFLQIVTGHFLPSARNAYRPHLLSKPWLLFFLTIILTSEGLYIASLASESSTKTFLSAVLPGEVIALTNVERSSVGDASLTENTLLDVAAQNKANDMAAKGYFSHVGPDGREPWTWISSAGYGYQYAGENLAVRFDQSSDVVRAWMASPTHRANIVKPVYTDIGIGIAEGMYQGSPATFVVQYFGTPMPAAALEAPISLPVAVAPRVAEQESSQVAGASTEKKSEQVATTSTLPPQVPVAEPFPEAGIESQQNITTNAAKVFLSANDASQTTIMWLLGGIGTLLVILLGFAFFVHIEIQPTDMLTGGAFVGVVALSLYMLNGAFINASGSTAQSAAVAQSVSLERSILVGSEATSTELGG